MVFFVCSRREEGSGVASRESTGERTIYERSEEVPGADVQTMAKLVDCCWQIDKEVQAIIRKTRSGDITADDEHFLSLIDSYWEALTYYVSNGPRYEQLYLEDGRISLRFDKWAHLAALIPTIHQRHPQLCVGDVCYLLPFERDMPVPIN